MFIRAAFLGLCFIVTISQLSAQTEGLLVQIEQGGQKMASLLKAPDKVDNLTAMGEAFLVDSKALQARAFFLAASEKAPESQDVKAHLAKADKKIEYLNKKIQEIQAENKVKDLPDHYCRIAAIHFHGGLTYDAIQLLEVGLKKHPRDKQLTGLKNVFLEGLKNKQEAIRSLKENFDQALGKEYYDVALEFFGQALFLSLGHVPDEMFLDPFLKSNQKLLDRTMFDAVKKIVQVGEAKK